MVRIDHLRDLLVFADGCILANNMKYGDYDFVLADLYAEDCEWAQTALAEAGCHPRGAYLETSPSGATDQPSPRPIGPE